MLRFSDIEVQGARSIIENAKIDLGEDLGGFSKVDLLADNMPLTLGEIKQLIIEADL